MIVKREMSQALHSLAKGIRRGSSPFPFLRTRLTSEQERRRVTTSVRRGGVARRRKSIGESCGGSRLIGRSESCMCWRGGSQVSLRALEECLLRICEQRAEANDGRSMRPQGLYDIMRQRSETPPYPTARSHGSMVTLHVADRKHNMCVKGATV